MLCSIIIQRKVMNPKMIYPIKTSPVFKQYLWGGDSLKKMFGKAIPDNFAAESWEVSCHRDGLCFVENGIYSGKTLEEVVFSNPSEMLGKENVDTFPLLVKLLDANKNLSVQVHPDNEFAAKYENGELGKTEMWYVVDAKPGAKLVYGLKPGVDADTFEKSLKDGNPEHLLNYVPVKKGDSFFIPAGTVHAIGEGLVIAEIQQSSNTTYRVYDYNRKDKDGNTRPLHVDKAVKATNYEFDTSAVRTADIKKEAGGTSSILASCEYFTVIRYNIDSSMNFSKNMKFEIIVCTYGKGTLTYNGNNYEINAGDSFFIPAAIDKYTISGDIEILRSFE